MANFGAPDSMSEGASESFLREFLSDPCVIPLPNPIRFFIAKKIAGRRAQIYADNLRAIAMGGVSPIVAHTDSLAKKVEKISGVKTLAAYRYGKRSIGRAVETARAAGARKFAVLPMYPQNCPHTTGSIERVLNKTKKFAGEKFSLSLSYHDNPLYIDALARRLSGAGAEAAIASFHSAPARGAQIYERECSRTAELVCEKAGVKNMLLGWQSKTGKGKWLEPETITLARKCASRGIKKIAVFCPGFSVDCTETLIEIGRDLRGDFLSRGGESLELAPCLNDSDDHAELFAALAKEIL